MSQEHFGQLRSEAAAPPKPRRMYRLPDDDADDDYYADAAAAAPDSHPRQHALHVSKVRLNPEVKQDRVDKVLLLYFSTTVLFVGNFHFGKQGFC